MPIFDLKRAQVRFQDGTTLVGAVNNSGGYSTGATTMLVTFTGEVPIASLFTLTGDTTEYTVTAVTNTSSNTSSITFAPGLVNAATNAEVITVGPNFIDVKVGEGTVSWDQKTPREYKLNRGLLYQVRNGNQEPMDIKIGFWWEFITHASGDVIPTPYEILNQTGLASGWTSTNPDPCSPYCVDIVILYAPICPAIPGEIIRFPQFYTDSLGGDAKSNEINTPGKCNSLAPVFTRSILNYNAL